MALGGPSNYKGRDMREAHKALNLKESDFGAVAGHLVGTLKQLGVEGKIFDSIVGAVVALKEEVLNQ
jgi:hemoglobin